MCGVTANDPAVFVAVPLTLLVVATVASRLPARRAAAVDPRVALRSEECRVRRGGAPYGSPHDERNRSYEARGN